MALFKKYWLTVFNDIKKLQLTETIESHMTGIVEPRMQEYKIDAFIKRIEENYYQTNDEIISDLKTANFELTQYIGSKTTLACSIEIIYQMILDKLREGILQKNIKQLKESAKAIFADLESHLYEYPDNAYEMRRVLCENEVRIPENVEFYKGEKNISYKRNEIGMLLKRLNAIDDDDTASGVVDIFTRFGKPIDNDDLHVNLASTNPIILKEVIDYIEDKVPMNIPSDEDEEEEEA